MSRESLVDLELRRHTAAGVRPRFDYDAGQVLLAAVHEALLAAEPAYWLRRARQMRWARPRPGDFTGRATVDARRERDERLAAAERACVERARVAAGEPTGWEDLLDTGRDMPMCPHGCPSCLLPPELQHAGVECRPTNAGVT